MSTEVDTEVRETQQLLPPIIRREVSICAVCKDDISTNLGRRRILFHFGDQLRSDPTTEVVKQMHDLMSLFANGVVGRQCDLTNCTQSFIESLSAKWCCRKCERMINAIYKKFQELQQFYNQFKDCPLSTLLNTFSVNNSDQISSNIDSNDENTITIHGVIIEETQLNEECNQVVTNSTNESDQTEAQKSPKKRKRTENELQKDENQEEEQKSPTNDNQRKTRSQTISGLNRSPPPEITLPKMNKKTKNAIIKEKKSNKKETKETVESIVEKEAIEETKSEEKKEIIRQEIKLSETDNQILSSLYSQYYEGILRAMLADNKLRSVTISEVGKFLSRECLTAGTEVAKMSHSIDTMKMPDFKKFIQCSLPSTLHLFSAITGKDKLLNPPIVSMISILIYVLNSHANMFQKMIATLLLNAKCSPSTIEKLHTYKLCIAYETLVSFIDNNTDLAQIPKLIKSFQFT